MSLKGNGDAQLNQVIARDVHAVVSGSAQLLVTATKIPGRSRHRRRDDHLLREPLARHCNGLRGRSDHARLTHMSASTTFVGPPKRRVRRRERRPDVLLHLSEERYETFASKHTTRAAA